MAKKKSTKATGAKSEAFKPHKRMIEVFVDGIELPQDCAETVPPPSKSKSDVTAHHWSWNGYHSDEQCGWVVDRWGNVIRAMHYHPFNDEYVRIGYRC